MKKDKTEITEDYIYTPNPQSCCKFCGIISFSHFHKAGSKPKDFVRVEHVPDMSHSDNNGTHRPKAPLQWEESIEKSLEHSVGVMQDGTPVINNSKIVDGLDRQKWEEDFEKYFGWVKSAGSGGKIECKAYKDFIRSLLTSQTSSLIKQLEAEKKRFNLDELPHGEEYIKAGHFNAGIQRAIELLTKEK